MTTRDSRENPQTTASEEASYYWVDPNRLTELHRSLEVILLGRRCLSCKDQPANVTQPPPAKEQIKHIVGCCAKDETFIRPGMAMQEIVFRVLLAGGNRPISLDDIHYQLTERWATPSNPMNIPKEGLKRVLDSDDFYGFRDVAQGEAD